MHLITRCKSLSVASLRRLLLLCSVATLMSCANIKEQPPAVTTADKHELSAAQPGQCAGEVVAPPLFVPLLTEIDDAELLSNSVKAKNEGGLCQGKAYRVNKPFEIFRAWNSNNPGSELGLWWSFNLPSGKIAEYRQDFAICPKWSPLDMMTRCTIKEGAHLVLGTGQSAFCNQFLTYEPSPDIQIYIQNADEATVECTTYYGIFSWQESHQHQ